ncbi:MAG: Phage tail tape measure protein [uncultured Nocardioidaceae bacterium]|uniref:Phage tail tape measure protein n=1 Tax=uncultured Nocardioidaceae bacterium TaxID=253824 RepID=A0A6J4MD77_9ACTN|nr:MAG: Phage tail tape measure protein [uncultured Nocardioidaceae bacterium]
MRHLPKHRAETPSATSKVARLAASGVAAGALAATPLIAVAPADAATSRTWNRLAECESGGNWHINTGNGYYGGLQFSASTWRGFGGGKYASYAHRATRDQQIRIAEKVLDVQGWGAWPACSSKLGLSASDARASDREVRDREGRHSYVVQRGDTFPSIAKKKNIDGGGKRLFRLNRDRLDGDRDNLRVGMRLKLYRWR